MASLVDRRSLLLGAGASMALPAAALARPRSAAQLIAAARRQVGVTLHYDPAYTVLGFPNGDVPRAKGVCTDVIVRAYRDAFAIDLQALVNADMRAAFAAYPKNWGLHGPDRNIDHRRVPNLRTWLRRRGAALAIPADASGWRPGDIFTSIVAGTGTHIGLVSDRRAPRRLADPPQYRLGRARGGCAARLADHRAIPLGHRLLIEGAPGACYRARAPPPKGFSMVPRYARPEMTAIWSPEARFRIWFEIEAHATDALADLGVVPREAAQALWDWWATDPAIDVAAIDAIEAVTDTT